MGIYLYFLPRLLVFSSHILVCDVFLRVCFVLFCETGSFCVAQAPASKCRDYGHEPSHPAKTVCLVLVLGLNETLMCSLYARHTFYLQASSLACWSSVVPGSTVISFTDWTSHLVGNQLAVGVWAYLLILISRALCPVSILMFHGCHSSDVGFEIRKYKPPSFLLFQDYFGCFGSFSIQFEFLKKKLQKMWFVCFFFLKTVSCVKLA